MGGALPVTGFAAIVGMVLCRIMKRMSSAPLDFDEGEHICLQTDLQVNYLVTLDCISYCADVWEPYGFVDAVACGRRTRHSCCRGYFGKRSLPLQQEPAGVGYAGVHAMLANPVWSY